MWKDQGEFISDFGDYQEIKEIKKKKPKGEKGFQYPTKNFLQNFKRAHQDFLKSKVPA